MAREQQKPMPGRTLKIAATVLIFCIAARSAPKYKVLHSFTGTDGSGPWGGVVLDGKGNVYAATAVGGNMQECNGYGCGVVFEATPKGAGKWTETILYSFRGGPNDGAVSYGNLVFDVAGNIYGTTHGGGTYSYGTAFGLTHGSSGWEESALYSFGTQSGDGGQPTSGLVIGQAGGVYGTAPNGGYYNGGTIFELSSDSSGWTETVLYAFANQPNDGAAPPPRLITDAAGNFYGTTQYGGIQCGSSSCGTVYELSHTSSGWVEAVLHRFHDNGEDGFTPGWGALAMDHSGRLYGSTRGGGCCGGVVYRLTPRANGEWKETIVYAFKGGAGGYEPNAGVVMDKSGNLYGTTDYGGSGDCGVIYRLAPKPKDKWKYTVLHTFDGIDGCFPEGNLVLDKKGNLYGGTVLGGATGNGVIFELIP